MAECAVTGPGNSLAELHDSVNLDSIMAATVLNRLRDQREQAGWSQRDLADRAGLSRAEVSAIETGRLVPSAGVALALAGVFGCAVEDLFRLGDDSAGEASGASGPARYWLANLGGRVRRIAAEPTHVGVLPHDGSGVGSGTGRGGRRGSGPPPDPRRTLVVAGCDPAVGLLSGFVSSTADVRVIPLVRSSRQSLELLRDGGAHVAGVHLGDDSVDNATVVRDALGAGYRRIHVARWTEGLALSPGLGHASVGAAVGARLRWVGREDGSGARRCLDMILEGRMPRPDGYERTASDHRGVVETIRTGWAQAGVCVEFTAREGGLDFLPVRYEDYDFFYPEDLHADPRVTAVLDVLRSSGFAHALSALPGYSTARTGELS
jgi:molybdate-binding protein/transcriptional regulator with XRE-family HTH domain